MSLMNKSSHKLIWKNTRRNSNQIRMQILKISVTICFELTAIAINNGLIENDIEERYNFKPIYAASSYIGKLDITSI